MAIIIKSPPYTTYFVSGFLPTVIYVVLFFTDDRAVPITRPVETLALSCDGTYLGPLLVRKVEGVNF